MSQADVLSREKDVAIQKNIANAPAPSATPQVGEKYKALTPLQKAIIDQLIENVLTSHPLPTGAKEPREPIAAARTTLLQTDTSLAPTIETRALIEARYKGDKFIGEVANIPALEGWYRKHYPNQARYFERKSQQSSTSRTVRR